MGKSEENWILFDNIVMAMSAVEVDAEFTQQVLTENYV